MHISSHRAYISGLIATCLAFYGGRVTSIFYLSSSRSQWIISSKEWSKKVSVQYSLTEEDIEKRSYVYDHIEGPVHEITNYTDEGSQCNEPFVDYSSPTKHHIAVDIKNLESHYLSEAHLLQSMEKFSDLTTLDLIHSYCHNNLSVDISCIGVLPHLHIVLLSSPLINQLHLNLFSYGNSTNVSKFMTAIKTIYSNQEGTENEVSKADLSSMQWAWRKKDLSRETLDIDGSSYTQSKNSRISREVFYEVLVHPAMLAHPLPKRVAIVGGRDGGTLREVLKHKSVNEVKMIQTSKEAIHVLQEFGTEWSECNEIHEDKTCDEDVKIDLLYEDAVSWMEKIHQDIFDVLFIDVSDPEEGNPLKTLDIDELFVHALHKSLSTKGVIAMHMGKAPFNNDPADQYTRNEWRSSLIDLLENAGFQSIHVYEDGISGFDGPILFLVATKDEHTSNKELWSRTNAQTELEIRYRMFVDAEVPSVQYFDSGVMSKYLLPHKSSEALFCKSIPTPSSCSSGLLYKELDVPISKFEVRASTIGDGSGRGVFTTVDIKKGSTIAKDARLVKFHPSSVRTVFDYMYLSKSQIDVYNYFEGYGWQSTLHGDNTFLVDSSILTFVNHGCNDTFNIDASRGGSRGMTEQNATKDDGPREERNIYDPFSDRNEHSIGYTNIAVRDITTGEEILCDYMYFTVNKDEWWDEVEVLKKICNKEQVGLITETERENSN